MAERAMGFDAAVIGAGPNGLAAAVTLAEAGKSVLVLEAEATVGGGARTAELTLPGFLHDVCSAVHPLAAASPVFSRMPLTRLGLEWVHSPAALAHPLEDGTAVMLEHGLKETARGLGEDGRAYEELLGPLAENWDALVSEILGPLRVPRHPWALARFGWTALGAARRVAESRFRGERARALFAGLAAHAMLPLEQRPTAGVALALAAAAHGAGWPVARGGSGAISAALEAYLRSLGGEIRTGVRVKHLESVPEARAMLCDVTPRQLAALAGGKLPAGFRRKLERYRYGPGVYKLDWALAGPIPWRAKECGRAATVHVGGTLEEIAAAEREVWEGRCAARPFVLAAQQSRFDRTRAPEGKETAWAYCHVPHGSGEDMTERIESQMERLAPGFRDLILDRSKRGPAELEAGNANLVGGDIAGGVQDLRQLFMRPTARTYGTPVPGLYLCSSSTPPGPGVHGMCGYWAAKRALRFL